MEMYINILSPTSKQVLLGWEKMQEFRHSGVPCSSLSCTLGWSLLQVDATVFLDSSFSSTSLWSKGRADRESTRLTGAEHGMTVNTGPQLQDSPDQPLSANSLSMWNLLSTLVKNSDGPYFLVTL